MFAFYLNRLFLLDKVLGTETEVRIPEYENR